MSAYDDTAWMEGALCAQVGFDFWFPEQGAEYAQAKAVCRRCPVRDMCLEYSQDAEIYDGIWGSLGTRSRRDLRAERRYSRSETEDAHRLDLIDRERGLST